MWQKSHETHSRSHDKFTLSENDAIGWRILKSNESIKYNNHCLQQTNKHNLVLQDFTRTATCEKRFSVVGEKKKWSWLMSLVLLHITVCTVARPLHRMYKKKLFSCFRTKILVFLLPLLWLFFSFFFAKNCNVNVASHSAALPSSVLLAWRIHFSHEQYDDMMTTCSKSHKELSFRVEVTKLDTCSWCLRTCQR